jgi:hypothetical protein
MEASQPTPVTSFDEHGFKFGMSINHIPFSSKDCLITMMRLVPCIPLLCTSDDAGMI